MLRVFLTLNFLFFNLYACKDTYHSCMKKVQDSQSIKNNSLFIPIKNNQLLIFSLTKPKHTILKHDPYLSLYIVKNEKGFKYPFLMNIREPSAIALVTNKKTKEIKISKRQVGLNNLAQLNIKINRLGLITNSCCFLEGIATKRGIIEKAYIKRFINIKNIAYSDIGIRVKDTKKGVMVVSYDPFMENNPFLIGDYILEMDGKRIKTSSLLMQDILFAKLASQHKVKIRRNGKIIIIDITSQKRLSGGYKIETYLEKYGLTFDKKLFIIKVDPNKNFYGLLVGDKLLKVNAHRVIKQDDVMKYISDFKLYPKLLFERDKNFQFFVDMN